MIICFRNFFRNNMVNLSARSVKHFLPDAQIYCFTLYKNSPDDYNEQEPLLDYITEYKFQTKFVNPNNSIQDTDEGGQTSGYGNHANGKYFSEGYNLIYDKFKNTDEVVLMLSEDHFFTTGKVLQELLNNEYDVAFANGYAPGEANGSILAIRPNKVSDMFPLPETRDTVEQLLLHHIIKKLNGRGYQIQNRKWLDYCGDGIYTNSSKEMIDELKKAQII